MPLVSVIVPAYDVERYLRESLESIAAQTLGDLEVIVVDDGSRDASRSIAEAVAARDPRFRVLVQDNAGLGAARNAGIAAARGEFLGFVDGDDVLPRDAYERLHRSLAQTGSDFAAGNVQRLLPDGTLQQAAFLRRAFARGRQGTHVTRFGELIADRIAPNKLWRRAFWDEHELRFPVGVVHEDIPVVVPAHFLARAVDVLAEPVYLYRTRPEGLSITQRRAELPVMLDRVAAVTQVRSFLLARGDEASVALYEASVVAEDLRYHVDVLPEADDAYRAEFLRVANELVEDFGPAAFRPLAAVERLKWELVRRRALPELLEVLRFQREETPRTVRIGRRWYRDLPFRGDPRLGIPLEIYRVPAPVRRVVPEPVKRVGRRALGRRPA